MTADSFVGHLPNGKRVYVRRLKYDKSGSPIAFAVFADVGRNGKMKLVGRLLDPESTPGSHQMYCANGWEHGTGACHWTRVPEPISSAEKARWIAHWWTHVGNAPSCVVALSPVGARP